MMLMEWVHNWNDSGASGFGGASPASPKAGDILRGYARQQMMEFAPEVFGGSRGKVDVSSSGWSSLDQMPDPAAAHGIKQDYPWDADARTYFRWYEELLFARAREEDRRLLLGGPAKTSGMLLAGEFSEIQIDTGRNRPPPSQPPPSSQGGKPTAPSKPTKPTPDPLGPTSSPTPTTTSPTPTTTSPTPTTTSPIPPSLSDFVYGRPSHRCRPHPLERRRL